MRVLATSVRWLVMFSHAIYNVHALQLDWNSSVTPSAGSLPSLQSSRVLASKAPMLPDIIIQYGKMRTSSTLQFQTLCLIMTLLHESEPERVRCGYSPNPVWDEAPDGTYSVLKTHNDPVSFLPLVKKSKRNVWLFESVRREDLDLPEEKTQTWQPAADFLTNKYGWDVKYAQVTTLLLKRGYMIFEDYKPIFGLSDAQMDSVMKYMRPWDVLRQCCGVQMSADWRDELQGKHLESQQQLPAHPRLMLRLSLSHADCKNQNVDAVESALMKTSLYRRFESHGPTTLTRVSNVDSTFSGHYCGWLNRQIACQNLHFNQQPHRPYC